jgi:quercetin dioxygenase-like cupin family protein
MTTTTETTLAPIFARPTLENTIWYGSAMISFLATAEMTDGHYALLRWRMQKGFTPPAPHRHGPEDFSIIRGQLRFWVAGEEIVATDGELVRTPPGIWHTLQVESDEAEFLTIFSPAGMEGFFRTLGRPAETMEFSPPGTTPQDMDKLLT